MKLRNIKEVEEFRKVIHTCTGDVYLKSQDGDVFNLKSALSEYIALGQLLRIGHNAAANTLPAGLFL